MKLFIRNICIFYVLSLIAVPWGSSLLADPNPANDNIVLTILHTNDMNANYGGFTDGNRFCYSSICSDGSGGILRLDRAVRYFREKYPDSLLVDLGDQLNGSLFWKFYKQGPAVTILNHLGYQYFIPGNRDLNSGDKVFTKFISGLKPNVLSANLTLHDPLPNYKAIAPYTIITRNNRKIGLIGIITTRINYSISDDQNKKIYFSVIDEIETLTKIVNELKSQNVDIIVALTHIGYQNDLKLAAEVEGLDVIVGAHSNTLLGEGLPGADGPYPTVVTSPTGHPVLIVSSGYQCRYLGQLSVTFDIMGIPVNWSGQPVLLNDQTLSEMKAPPHDAILEDYLSVLSLPIQRLLETGVGEIVGQGQETVLDVDINSCRRQECRSGNVLADAILALVPRAQIAIINGGAIRTSLPVGEVSMVDLPSVIPFKSYIWMTEISGQDLKQVLERSISNPETRSSGKFLQVAGMRFTYGANGDNPVILTVEIFDGENWQPLQANSKYLLVSTDFLGKGGNGYQVLKRQNWLDSGKLVTDVILDYFKKGPVNTDFSWRIRRIN
jgi:5'-nucleotidase